jgi:hypothetical protein
MSVHRKPPHGGVGWTASWHRQRAAKWAKRLALGDAAAAQHLAHRRLGLRSASLRRDLHAHAYDAAGSCYQAGRKGIREFIAPTAGGKADRVDQLRALGSWSVISSGRGMCIRRLRLRRQLARSFRVVLRPWLSLQRQVASLSSKISALVEMARATACVGPLVSNAFLTLVPASSSGRLTFRRPAGTL